MKTKTSQLAENMLKKSYEKSAVVQVHNTIYIFLQVHCCRPSSKHKSSSMSKSIAVVQVHCPWLYGPAIIAKFYCLAQGSLPASLLHDAAADEMHKVFLSTSWFSIQNYKEKIIHGLLR